MCLVRGSARRKEQCAQNSGANVQWAAMRLHLDLVGLLAAGFLHGRQGFADVGRRLLGGRLLGHLTVLGLDLGDDIIEVLQQRARGVRGMRERARGRWPLGTAGVERATRARHAHGSGELLRRRERGRTHLVTAVGRHARAHAAPKRRFRNELASGLARRLQKLPEAADLFEISGRSDPPHAMGFLKPMDPQATSRPMPDTLQRCARRPRWSVAPRPPSGLRAGGTERERVL